MTKFNYNKGNTYTWGSWHFWKHICFVFLLNCEVRNSYCYWQWSFEHVISIVWLWTCNCKTAFILENILNISGIRLELWLVQCFSSTDGERNSIVDKTIGGSWQAWKDRELVELQKVVPIDWQHWIYILRGKRLKVRHWHMFSIMSIRDMRCFKLQRFKTPSGQSACRTIVMHLFLVRSKWKNTKMLLKNSWVKRMYEWKRPSVNATKMSTINIGSWQVKSVI